MPGGFFSTAAGDYSFAAGRQAKANHNGAFVWADQTNANFASTGEDQFLIRASGGVGIGTTTPGFRLVVKSDASTTAALKVEQSGNTDGWGLVPDHTNGSLHFERFGGGAGTYVTFENFGNVGIGTTDPTFPLEMASGAHVTTGGVWTDASSREYKENIRTLSTEEAVTALGGLQPTRFNYKVDKEDEHVGFIAEDVPDLVASKERRGLSPMDIVAVLTKVVQEQQKRLEQLEARLNARQE